MNLEGSAEVMRSFAEIDKKLRTEFGAGLKTAAEPVVSSAKSKVARYAGASVSTIRARRAGPRVYVEQGAKKVTGQHGQFGALQMTEVLIPALEEHHEEVLNSVQEVLDKYATGAGF